MHSLTCMMHPIQLIFVLSFIIKFQIQLCGSIHTSFQRKIILYNKSYHNQYIHSGHILYVVGIADCATINQFARRPLRSLVKEGILAVYEIGKYLSDKHLLHFLLIFQRYKIKFRRKTNSICDRRQSLKDEWMTIYRVSQKNGNRTLERSSAFII